MGVGIFLRNHYSVAISGAMKWLLSDPLDLLVLSIELHIIISMLKRRVTTITESRQ